MVAGGLTGAVTATPANAAPAPVDVASCVKPTGALAFRGRRGLHGVDPDTVTRAEARAVQSMLDRPSMRSAGTALPDVVTIPVRAHAIDGTHRADHYISDYKIRASIKVLNDAYAGKQSEESAATRYVFKLTTTSHSRNDHWYHLTPDTKYDHAMKRTLHRGGSTALNLYFVKPPASTGLLGWSSFPWDYAGHPNLDGVVINVGSVPGGSIKDYNLGDTATHEVGHWMGLLHTFSDYGVCEDNDGVGDTPVQRTPSHGCPTGADTCRASPGTDPIHNFMDYSYDSCMYEFTGGQTQRMDQAWAELRDPS